MNHEGIVDENICKRLRGLVGAKNLRDLNSDFHVLFPFPDWFVFSLSVGDTGSWGVRCGKGDWENPGYY